MIRACAWCQQEGRGDAAIMGERAPFDDKRVTHGLCDEHLETEYANMARDSRDAVSRERYITWPALYNERGGEG